MVSSAQRGARATRRRGRCRVAEAEHLGLGGFLDIHFPGNVLRRRERMPSRRSRESRHCSSTASPTRLCSWLPIRTRRPVSSPTVRRNSLPGQENNATNQLVANVVDPVRPETWVFHYCLSIWTADDAPETAEERRALFKHYMSQYCEPYRSAGEWLSQATPIRAEKVRLDDFIGGR